MGPKTQAKAKTGRNYARSVVSKLKRGYLSKREREKKYFVPEEGPYYYPAIPYKEEKPEKKKPEKEEKEGKKEVEGIEISKIPITVGGVPLMVGETPESLKDINISYNLVPRSPRKGEQVLAYANIKWNPKMGGVVYYIIEPNITKADLETIENVKRLLEERLDIDFIKLGEVKSKRLLRDEIRKIVDSMPGVAESKKGTLSYYIERDIIGLGKIESLMNDPNIEDISCDGVNIPVYVYHRDPKLGSLKTNIVFKEEDELNTFVIKIAQKCKKSISIAEPLLDATLPDGSRLQATLGTDIARKGSNFTIRRFTEQPLTPTHMLRYGTLNSMQLAYLWLAIENGQSILISGGTATGKTSLLNALSLFIRPNLKVVSIEDTAELRLPHPHWIPEVARTPLSIKGSKGEVTLFDLLKSSLRQRPDYIVMGEVRGKEAFVLFQQMATGHPSLATIHAASISQLMDRLTTPPISLPPSLLENINIIVFLVFSRLRGRYIRRSDSILEVTGIKDKIPVTKEIFKWKPLDDSFGSGGKSVVLHNISVKLGLTQDSIKEELIRRKSVLEWMLREEIFDYRDVAKVINIYYSNPQRVLNLISKVT
ncbi:MAG: type II/IV secretion system ATPase subunit [Candidatus Aenigmarchaeota archaeon]|nr:type II/IV secretion system ATPase subunit [Candidatus Aenigmarchaeota archaeon]